MIRHFLNWIKGLFHKKEEKMDPHEELYSHVPESEIKVEKTGELKPCENHGTYANRCKKCRKANI